MTKFNLTNDPFAGENRKETGERGLSTRPRGVKEIIVAGLTVLSMNNFNSPPLIGEETMRESDNVIVAKNTFKDVKVELEEILDTLDEAEQIASKKKGMYPFDEKGRKKLLNGLKKAQNHCNSFVKNNTVGREEGEGVLSHIRNLQTAVLEFRTIEMKDATCYMVGPMFLDSSPISGVARIRARISLLNKLPPGKISPEVARKAISAMEMDIERLSKSDDSKMKELVQNAKTSIDNLK
ncbi:hypothetical protein HYY75_12390, partial [bacterium]|nr:hypothetical protein [bacterium]